MAEEKRRHKKRGNGEGSIKVRKDGRYEVAVTDPATGKRSSAYTKTNAEAERLRRRMTVRAEDGDVVIGSGAILTAYTESWLADRAGRRRRPSTVREYEYRLRKWVLPKLGATRVRNLTVTQVEDLLDDLVAQGLAEGTVKSIRNALPAVLQDAARARHLTANVARTAQMPEFPESGDHTAKMPTGAQVVALLEAARDSELEDLLVLIVGTGARIGEALAMQWADVNLDLGLWCVRRTITRDRSGRAILGSRTKSGPKQGSRPGSRRPRPLRRQKAAVARLQISAVHWESHDLVFPSSIGTPQDPHNVRRVFKRIGATVGFDGSFHALRHWFASLAVTVMPDVTVSKILGHARTSTTTDLYAHLRASDPVSCSAKVFSSRCVPGRCRVNCRQTGRGSWLVFTSGGAGLGVVRREPAHVGPRLGGCAESSSCPQEFYRPLRAVHPAPGLTTPRRVRRRPRPRPSRP